MEVLQVYQSIPKAKFWEKCCTTTGHLWCAVCPDVSKRGSALFVCATRWLLSVQLIASAPIHLLLWVEDKDSEKQGLHDMLLQSCCTTGSMVVKITIELERTKTGCSGIVLFEKRMMIAYYKGKLITPIYMVIRILESRYGERMISANIKNLQTYAVHIIHWRRD